MPNTYEYMIADTTDGRYDFLDGPFKSLDKANEQVDIYKTFKAWESRKLIVMQRLVMAWEPVKEEGE